MPLQSSHSVASEAPISIYVTDDGGENPYSSLPSNEIWTLLSSTGGVGVVPRLHTAGRRAAPRVPRRPSSGSAVASHSSLMPDTALITNPTLTRRLDVVEASAEFLVASSSPRLFLATGRRTMPRWWTGSSPQIAADWMIENNRLYAYAGTGTDWVWTPSGEVTFEALGQQVRWRSTQTGSASTTTSMHRPPST